MSVILLEFRFLVEYRIRMSRSNLDLIHIVDLLIIERDVYKAQCSQDKHCNVFMFCKTIVGEVHVWSSAVVDTI